MYWVEDKITGHKRTDKKVLAIHQLSKYSLFIHGRNIKRNILQKMMEWDEDGQVEDLDLSLPGRAALGQGLWGMQYLHIESQRFYINIGGTNLI